VRAGTVGSSPHVALVDDDADDAEAVEDEDFAVVDEADNVELGATLDVGFTHLPLLQIVLLSQRFSQDPQFLGSLLVSAQTPSHNFSAELVLYGPHV
jgi:hypothetical protein